MQKSRLWLVVCVAVAAGFVGGLLSKSLVPGNVAFAQEAAGHPKLVVAEEFRLVDKTGKQRAVLDVLPDGEPRLLLFDKAGNRGAVFTSMGLVTFTEDGEVGVSLTRIPGHFTGLTVWNEAGKARGMFGVDAKGRAQVELCDKAGRQRAALRVLSDGTSGLSFLDEAANQRAMLFVAPGGMPVLNLCDKKGLPLGMFGLKDDLRPYLELYQPDGGRRVSLGVGADGAALTLLDDKGKPRAGLAVLPEGSGGLMLLDSAGKPIRP